MMKTEGSGIRIRDPDPGSGSISPRHGSADPDPHQNVMDPQHCLVVNIVLVSTRIFILKILYQGK
jgi:hypothetical protein